MTCCVIIFFVVEAAPFKNGVHGEKEAYVDL